MIKHTQPEFHFLLTSAFTWSVGTDLHELMQQQDKRKEGLYWVWYVPGPKSAAYEIDTFQPQVEGAFVLAQVEPKQRGKKGARK